MMDAREFTPAIAVIIDTEVGKHGLVLEDPTTWQDMLDPLKTAESVAQRTYFLGITAGLPALTLKQLKLIEGSLLLWHYSCLPPTHAKYVKVNNNITQGSYLDLILASQNEASDTRTKTKTKAPMKTLLNLNDKYSYDGNTANWYAFDKRVKDTLTTQGWLHVLEQGIPDRHNPNKSVSPEENAAAKTFLKDACSNGSKINETEDALADKNITFYTAYSALSSFTSTVHSNERELAINEAEGDWNNLQPITGESVKDIKIRITAQINIFISLQSPKTETAKANLLSKLIADKPMFQSINQSIIINPSTQKFDTLFTSMLALEKHATSEQLKQDAVKSKIRAMLTSGNTEINQMINAEAVRINEFKNGNKGKKRGNEGQYDKESKKTRIKDLPDGVTKHQLTAYKARFEYPAPYYMGSMEKGELILKLPKPSQDKLTKLIKTWIDKNSPQRTPDKKSYMASVLDAWDAAIKKENPPSYGA